MAPPKKTKATSAVTTISGVVAGSPVLPGESESEYRQALAQTIQELGASSAMQIYLAEKICDCLWWIRRYEEQKRATLIREMANLLIKQGYGDPIPDHKMKVLDALFANKSNEYLKAYLERKGHTLETLQQEAFLNVRTRFREIDELIALKTKTLAGFLASYEVLTNRKLNRERLELQNTLLRRDLQAIEHDDKPQKAPGQ